MGGCGSSSPLSACLCACLWVRPVSRVVVWEVRWGGGGGGGEGWGFSAQ